MSYKRKSPQPIIEGGTNATSFATTDGTVIYDGTKLTTLASTGTTGQALVSAGAGVAPAYGTLPVAGGGTNATSFATTDGTVIFDGTRLVTLASTGTTGQALVSAGAGVAPAYGTLPVAGGGTNATSFSVTDGTVYFDGTRLVTTATGTSGQILTSAGAGVAPSYASPAASSISITGDTGGALTGAAFTFAGGTTGLSFGGSGSTETLTFAGITANGGTVSLATDATTSTINVGTGAGAKTSTFGSVSSTSATTVQSGSGALNVTATGGALTINSGVGALSISNDASATTVTLATGGAVKTVTVGSTSSTSTTTIACGTGGLNLGTSANAHATTVGSTTASATTTVQAPSGGVFALGVAGVTPSNINMVTINTSTGQLGSQAVPSSTFTWNDVTGGSATLAAANGYIADKSTLTTFTMPTNNAIGDTITIVGKGSGGWNIVYTTGQNIIFGTSTTTTTTGNLASTQQTDVVNLVCTTASASAPIFSVTYSIGNITVA